MQCKSIESSNIYKIHQNIEWPSFSHSYKSSFQAEINFLFLENRDKREKSLFILIFNHLVFRDKIQIHNIFKKNKKKYLVNKTFILIFKVLVFKDKLRNCGIFLYLLSRFSFYTYFQEKKIQIFSDLSLFSRSKFIPIFRACLFQSEEG